MKLFQFTPFQKDSFSYNGNEFDKVVVRANSKEEAQDEVGRAFFQVAKVVVPGAPTPMLNDQFITAQIAEIEPTKEFQADGKTMVIYPFVFAHPAYKSTQRMMKK